MVILNRSLLEKLKSDDLTLYARIDDKGNFHFVGGWQKLSVFFEGMPTEEVRQEMDRTIIYQAQNENEDELYGVIVGGIRKVDVLNNYVEFCKRCLKESGEMRQRTSALERNGLSPSANCVS